MTAQQDPPERPADALFVHSRTEQGDGFKVVRVRDASIEVGEIREVKEGRPIHGELVKLKQRPEHEQLFDVEVLVPGPARAGDEGAHGRSGPAQVATEAYRANWAAIFGASSGPSDGEPN